MTSSGTNTYTQNRDQIIRRAARLVGAIAAGDTPSSALIQDFSDALNAMVKRWSASGLHLWAEQEATLFLQPNQAAYTLGTGTTDHATQTYTATTLSASANSSATSISVTSATGIATTYNIGIVLNGGSIFWTTVNGAPSGTTVTLAAGLTDSATSGNAVYVYQTNMQRPLRVLSARRYNYASAIETSMNPPFSRIDYRDLPNKSATGTPTQFFYDPQIPAGVFYIWPLITAATDAVKFTWMRQLQDFNTASNTPDFPQEWIDTLVFNLALCMSPEFGVPTEQYNKIKEQALAYLDMAVGFDREPESYYFQVDTSRMGG